MKTRNLRANQVTTKAVVLDCFAQLIIQEAVARKFQEIDVNYIFCDSQQQLVQLFPVWDLLLVGLVTGVVEPVLYLTP